MAEFTDSSPIQFPFTRSPQLPPPPLYLPPLHSTSHRYTLPPATLYLPPLHSTSHRYTLPPTATLYLPPPPAPPPRAYCVIFSQDGIDVGLRLKKRGLCDFRRLALACRETVQVLPGIASLTRGRVSAIGNASHLRSHIAAQRRKMRLPTVQPCSRKTVQPCSRTAVQP